VGPDRLVRRHIFVDFMLPHQSGWIEKAQPGFGDQERLGNLKVFSKLLKSRFQQRHARVDLLGFFC
jgi:hypothetical protein